MPVTVTVLLTPAFLLAKLAAVLLTSSRSPATRSSPRVTLAVVVASYTRPMPVACTVRMRGVIELLALPARLTL